MVALQLQKFQTFHVIINLMANFQNIMMREGHGVYTDQAKWYMKPGMKQSSVFNYLATIELNVSIQR